MTNSQTPISIDEIGDKLQFKTEEVGITVGNFFQKGFSILLGLIGLGCTITGITQIESLLSFGWFAFIAFLGVLPMVTSFWLLKNANKTAKAKRHSVLERKILKMMMRKNGNITPQQVAFQLAISVDDAHDTLAKLYSKGMLESCISEQGVLYYELSESMTWNKKMLK
jgi:predicted DNA-binding transcriptional regulator